MLNSAGFSGFNPNPFALGSASSLDMQRQMALQSLMSMVGNGIVPSLAELELSPLGQAIFSQPDSPASMAYQSRITAILNYAGPIGQIRARQLMTESAVKTIEQVFGALMGIYANLEQGSPQAQAMQFRFQALMMQRLQLIQQFQVLVFQDPSRGQRTQGLSMNGFGQGAMMSGGSMAPQPTGLGSPSNISGMMGFLGGALFNSHVGGVTDIFA